MKKIIMAVVLMISTSFFALPVNAAGGCGNFAQIDFYDARCVDEACGFLWLEKQANYQSSLWEKECVNGNNQTYYEYDVRDVKLGCC